MAVSRGALYERLENGFGTSSSNNSNGAGSAVARWRLTWKKVAVLATFAFVVICLSGRRGAKAGRWASEFIYPPGSTATVTTPSIDDSHHPTSTILSTHPTTNLTHLTDPDPSLTTFCAAPHNPVLPLVQYALIIDAGSTGSRIHVYKFNNCKPGDLPAYEYEVFEHIQPGLSWFSLNAGVASSTIRSDIEKEKENGEGGHPLFALAAARSLDPLLATALRVVPKYLWPCTSLSVKATAGLRQLPSAHSEAILRAVEWRLRKSYPFQLVPAVNQVEGYESGQTASENGGKSHRKEPRKAVEIMDGREEGIYAWVTANYLLGAIGGSGSPHSPRTSYSDFNIESPREEKSEPRGTYAVLDLGGASTQIAFEPAFKHRAIDSGADGNTGKHVFQASSQKYELTFGGRTHVLYQHSYLGYGLMQARKRVHRIVSFLEGVRPSHQESEQAGVVPNPCINRGMRKAVEVDIGDGSGKKRNVTMSGEGGVGGFEACRRLMEVVLVKDAPCSTLPCSFNGVYQPPVHSTFSHGRVLLLSYFYDRVNPLLSFADSISSPPQLTVSTIAALARTVCAGPDAWSAPPPPFAWEQSSEAVEELRGRPEHCLDLTFMYVLLRLGYGFGEERPVEFGKRVGGTELGWCLGAVLVGEHKNMGKCERLE